MDLNLYAVFAALDRERSVTRAAAALGLSQPAVSHALKRLRHVYKDPLFARTATGMEPTPRARELSDVVGEAVGRLRATLDADDFDPVTAEDRIVLAMNNHATIVLGARLAGLVATRAPRLRLAIRPSGTLDVASLMRRGLVDLAIGPVDPEAGGERHLLSDRLVVVMRRGHPLASGALDPERFASADHVGVSSLGGDAVDEALARRGIARTVRIEVPYIATAALLATSDMVGVVPEGIALALCGDPHLVWRGLPVEVPPIGIGMAWSPLAAQKASHRWLRATVADLASGVRRPRAEQEMVRASGIDPTASSSGPVASAPVRPGD